MVQKATSASNISFLLSHIVEEWVPSAEKSSLLGAYVISVCVYVYLKCLHSYLCHSICICVNVYVSIYMCCVCWYVYMPLWLCAFLNNVWLVCVV